MCPPPRYSRWKRCGAVYARTRSTCSPVPSRRPPADLALQHPAGHYLFPCRGSGAAPSGTEVSYLDEHLREADWVLVGCERSREIHRHFYRRGAPVVEMCPRELLTATGEAREPVLTKCCRLEEEIDQAGLMVVVPWGATLGHVQQGLEQLVATVGPEWVRE